MIILQQCFIVPSKPVGVDGVATGPNTIKLTWQPPQLRGDITAYMVHHFDTFLNDNMTYTVIPAVPEFVVKDLTEGALHIFTVTARSDNGESEKSNPARVTTFEFCKYN